MGNNKLSGSITEGKSLQGREIAVAVGLAALAVKFAMMHLGALAFLCVVGLLVFLLYALRSEKRLTLRRGRFKFEMRPPRK